MYNSANLYIGINIHTGLNTENLLLKIHFFDYYTNYTYIFDKKTRIYFTARFLMHYKGEEKNEESYIIIVYDHHRLYCVSENIC